MAAKKTIHELALAGRVQPLVKAIKAGADVNALDEHNATPIMYAIAANRQSAFTELSLRGATIPATYPSGECVLTRAVKSGFLNMVFYIAPELRASIPAAREACNSRDLEYALDLAEHGKEEAKRLWREDFPKAAKAQQQGSEITQVFRALNQPVK